ncbi:polysaccharide biosynthesis C-terminal domain-containing protein [uncultured Jatrophihabitans sp.]|uniref:lipopolysaccharide biosynthesis protein n=1 Tax=uncultured Jatrophihabitans sp. TaxID=1610747 RepID=UPI0035C9F9E2
MATAESKAAKVSLSSRMVTNAFGNLAPIAAAVVTAPILAHALGVTERGQVAAATAPFLLATSCATLGVPDAVTYFVARRQLARRMALRHAIRIILLSSTVTCLAVIALSGPLSGGDHTIRRLMIVSAALIIPGLFTAVLRGAAAGEHFWKRVTRERMINAAFRLVSIVVLALIGRLDTLTATLAISLAPSVGALAYLRMPVTAEVTTAAVTDGVTGLMMRYGSRVWVGAVSGVLLSRLDQTIMTPLSAAYQLGLYAVAVSIGELPLIVNTAVREVMFSADAARGNDDELTRAARVSFALSVAVAGLIGGTLWLWLPAAFGSQFRPATGVAIVLIIAVALGTPGSIAGSGLSARGRPGMRSLSLTFACVVNIGLLVLLVPHYGAYGAAYATLAGNVISSNGCIVFMTRGGKLRTRDFYLVRPADLRVIGSGLLGVARRRAPKPA